MKYDNQFFLSYKEEEMLPYAYAYLQTYYPSSNGWNRNYSHVKDAFSPDFVVERHNAGCIQRAAVEVISTKKISKNDIRSLDCYGEILNGRGYKVEKIFIVSADCDTSLVPEDTRIIFMKEFNNAN